jgi:hypothetical protein
MNDPVSDYFARYPKFSFRYSPKDWRQKGPFNALGKHLGWSPKDREEEYPRFKETWKAFVQEVFPRGALSDYQTLCADLRIKPIPNTIDDCKEMLSTVHVNIVDLIQFRIEKRYGSPPTPLIFFENVQKLKEYTDETEKWYPAENGGPEILRALYHDIY